MKSQLDRALHAVSFSLYHLWLPKHLNWIHTSAGNKKTPQFVRSKASDLHTSYPFRMNTIFKDQWEDLVVGTHYTNCMTGYEGTTQMLFPDDFSVEDNPPSHGIHGATFSQGPPALETSLQSRVSCTSKEESPAVDQGFEFGIEKMPEAEKTETTYGSHLCVDTSLMSTQTEGAHREIGAEHPTNKTDGRSYCQIAALFHENEIAIKGLGGGDKSPVASHDTCHSMS